MSNWVPPFTRKWHSYVILDSQGAKVCKCSSIEDAQQLEELLNVASASEEAILAASLRDLVNGSFNRIKEAMRQKICIPLDDEPPKCSEHPVGDDFNRYDRYAINHCLKCGYIWYKKLPPLDNSDDDSPRV